MSSTLSTRLPSSLYRTGPSLSEKGEGLIKPCAAVEVDEGLTGSADEEDINLGRTTRGTAFGAKTVSNSWMCLKPRFAILGWMTDPFKRVTRSFIEGSAAYFPRQGA